MKLLVAEDNRVSRRVLEAMIAEWGYEAVVTCDGNEAWAVLERADAPKVAILDWLMPGLDGLELCRKVKALDRSEPTYLLICTIKGNREDLIAALEAGAD